MLSRLREHFGTAGLVVAIVALIAALAGGAIAANGGSDGKATASAKGKQGPRGKTGKTGKTGPQGPAGPAGPAGPQGPAGPKGDTGAPGTNGSDGAKGATGPTGNDGKNGKDGTIGFTETLPAGKTETGMYGGENPLVTETAPGIVKPAEIVLPISFTIPVDPAPTFVYIPRKASPPPGCPGLENGKPLADPGFLCVYSGEEFAQDEEFEPIVLNPGAQTVSESGGLRSLVSGVGPAGTVLTFTCGKAAIPACKVKGTWAVTAAS